MIVNNRRGFLYTVVIYDCEQQERLSLYCCDLLL